MTTGFVNTQFMDEDDYNECIEAVLMARNFVDKMANKHCDGSVKDFREQYEAGNFGKIYDMQILHEAAGRLLSAYAPQIASMARSFSNNRWAKSIIMMEYDDWYQMACLTFTDSVYTFNGSVKFNTYALRNVRNRLTDELRKYQMNKRMANIFNEDELPCGIEGKKMTLDQLAITNEEDTESFGEYDINLVKNLIKKVSPLEQELLEGKMSGEYGFLSHIALKHINPRTGKPYTRAGMSSIFNQLCVKIKGNYEQAKRHRIAA